MAILARHKWLLFAAWTILSSTYARADLTLDFSTLPSAQGFTYFAGGNGGSFSESEVFSVNGQVLLMDTIGQPNSGSGGNGYIIESVLDTDSPFTVTWSSRVLQDEGAATFGNAGWSIEAHFSNNAVIVGMSVSQLDVWDGNSRLSIAWDNSEFQEYQAVVQPGAGWSLLIDGNAVYSNLAFYTQTAFENELKFGDLTGFQNTRTEIQKFELTTSVVPEPGSLVFTVFSTACLFTRRSLRRR